MADRVEAGIYYKLPCLRYLSLFRLIPDTSPTMSAQHLADRIDLLATDSVLLDLPAEHMQRMKGEARRTSVHPPAATTHVTLRKVAKLLH